MSGYGRGRLLLSENESEVEQNNERRRHPNITPYDRQPVPSVSSERQSAVTGQRPSRFEIYGNTRRIPHDFHPQWQIKNYQVSTFITKVNIMRI
jgi:hypothetical protein